MAKSPARQASPTSSADAAGPAPRTAGRPTQDAAFELRERLLSAATQVFRAEGFGAARVEEIAARAGISKTTVYRQFGTKEELFRAAIWHGMQDLRGRLEKLLKTRRDFPKTLALLLRVLTEHMAAADTIEITRVVVGESHRFPDVANSFLQHVNEMLEPVASFIARADHEGTISAPDALAAARDLLTLVAGSAEVLMGIATTPAQRERRATHIEQLLLAAWRYKYKTPRKTAAPRA
ncbi:TetR/AcrR family transcriptional regulator [Paraburkholderia graminis]|uniref:TetR/AcrR family transcriptional regulator n=1 Tax=Paraburkholderia graminis TaxID=60548 RepID=UPI0038BBE774